jgi:hypothetical protein
VESRAKRRENIGTGQEVGAGGFGSCQAEGTASDTLSMALVKPLEMTSPKG